MNAPEMDLQELYRAERTRWYAEQSPRRSLADLFGMMTPWTIVLVFVAAYALSAPHTAHIMNLITPGAGWVAPVAVEFALIWSAFEIRRAKSANVQPLPAARFLRWFMLVIAVATNAAGGLSAVVAGTGVTELSATALWAAFAALPLVTQAALSMVIVAALAVPITAEATGGAIAQLVFEPRQQGDFRERAWNEVAGELVYRALFVKLNGTGLPPNEAAKLARREIKGYLGTGSKSEVRRNEPEDTGASADTPAKPRRGKGEAIAQLEGLYGELSDIPPVSVIVAETGIGKSTVYEWSSRRKKQNGAQ